MTSSANIKSSAGATAAIWVTYTNRSEVTYVFGEVLRATEGALRFCYMLGQRSELPEQSHSHHWERLIKHLNEVSASSADFAPMSFCYQRSWQKFLWDLKHPTLYVTRHNAHSVSRLFLPLKTCASGGSQKALCRGFQWCLPPSITSEASQSTNSLPCSSTCPALGTWQARQGN